VLLTLANRSALGRVIGATKSHDASVQPDDASTGMVSGVGG
jgi:hypothetical protein